MAFMQIQEGRSELLLDTPNREEILKAGPPASTKLNVLGRGSYGVVFKGVYAGKQVAVKIMKNFNKKADAINNEAHILGWRHCNIVQLLKIESTTNYGIVIMERFPGQCLQIILDSVRLQLEHRIFITLDVANALVYCHKRGILHLDIKPQNILVALSMRSNSRKRKQSSEVFDRRYICKLCDFGSSMKVMSSEQHNSRRVHGTVRYMSPEALKDELLLPVSDVFSLGVTMWQLKNRQIPYSWIECNEIVAYQVVKNNLRPNAVPPETHKLNVALIVSSAHRNCLCEYFSSEISRRSLDQIRTILQKTKTLSPLQPTKSVNHQRPEKLKKQISRNLIGTFQSTFAGLKEDLLVDKVSCDTLERELRDDFQLKGLFREIPHLVVTGTERVYEELFVSCWSADVKLRPSILDVKRILLGMFSQRN